MPRLAKSFLTNLGDMSEHGRVHELVVELDGRQQMHSWSARRPWLLWERPSRALVFVHGTKVPRLRRGEPPRDNGAAATYERFHSKEADGYRDDVLIPLVPMKYIGRAVHIAYRGPRWDGKVAQHDFGRKVEAYMGKSGAKKVYVIRGGRLRMTARGIEG